MTAPPPGPTAPSDPSRPDNDPPPQVPRPTPGTAGCPAEVIGRLSAVIRKVDPSRPVGPPGETTVLADRPDGTVVRRGALVAKAHAPDADPAALAARLRIAAHPRCTGTLLAPLPTADQPDILPDGRMVTLWPYGEPVSPKKPESAPWDEAGTLLARLHAVPLTELPGPLPPMRGPAKAARAIARLRAAPAPVAATDVVLRTWAGLPGWARGEMPGAGMTALCHGDVHLGQFVRHPAAADGRWLLIDVDDLGTGDPAWDLARPAAWYATGLLAPEDWARLLGAYRAAGGCAVHSYEDPWPRLDVPARALTAQTAAIALTKAAAAGRPLDAAEEAMVDACSRIARLTTSPRP